MFAGFSCGSPISCIHPTVLAWTHLLLPAKGMQVIILRRLSLCLPLTWRWTFSVFMSRGKWQGRVLGMSPPCCSWEVGLQQRHQISSNHLRPAQRPPLPVAGQLMPREGYQLSCIASREDMAAVSPDLARRPSCSDLAKSPSIHGMALLADGKQNT